MLRELRIENLLLIEHAELRLAEGLNAITGETGAGKTILAHAFDLLLGGKPRPDIVRPGASEAYVEGVFDTPPGLLDSPELGELAERIEPDDELVIARRVSREGRSRAFVCGRSASAGDLRELGQQLVSFYGQHEHRKLMLSASQLEILDQFCGDAHLRTLDEFATVHGEARELRGRLDSLSSDEASVQRELELLGYELEEIEDLDPSEDDKAQLVADRERLRQLEGLRTAAGVGAESLEPLDGEQAGVGSLCADAERSAEPVAGVDAQLDALRERLAALRIEAADLAQEFRAYSDRLADADDDLDSIEQRLDRYERLERKHGGSVADVLAHAERCRTQRDRLAALGTSSEETKLALSAAQARERELAQALSAARSAASGELAALVRSELAALAMPEADFLVELEQREELTSLGAERVEFKLAANPGVSTQSLRETASGGELSRVMLALMSVAGTRGVQATRTLVFDEVDAGVGGQTARAVGERLRGIGVSRQVVCITHLPQVASLADRHFRIAKDTARDVARTLVEEVSGDELVDELCRMLGADSSDRGARRHAEELLATA